jgi:hypothetical protein
MTFLIRMAFWFSLVLLALPFNFGAQDETVRSVGPIEALFAAKEAVSDVAGICERKPDVCETGRAAFDTISVRAVESARIAADLIEADGAQQQAFQPVEAVAATQDSFSTGTIIPVPTARPSDAPHS